MDNFLILKERHIIDTEWSSSTMTKTLKTGRGGMTNFTMNNCNLLDRAEQNKAAVPFCVNYEDIATQLQIHPKPAL